MADEKGWLIEAAWTLGNPSYLCVIDGSGVMQPCFGWTSDWNSHSEHDRALRFARKQDADAFVRALWHLQPDLLRGPQPLPQPRIVEHSWSTP